MIKYKPKLEKVEVNPQDYDLIILGMPVWAWSINPVIRSFLNKYKISGKPIAIWLTAGGNGLKAIKKLKSELKSSKIINEKIFQEPLNDPEKNKEMAKNWAIKLIEDLKTS